MRSAGFGKGHNYDFKKVNMDITNCAIFKITKQVHQSFKHCTRDKSMKHDRQLKRNEREFMRDSSLQMNNNLKYIQLKIPSLGYRMLKCCTYDNQTLQIKS